MAVQEQALRSIEAEVYNTRQDLRCRLCRDAPEAIRHIAAGWKMLAGRAYVEYRN